MYALMNKDREIATFTITSGDFGDIYAFSQNANEKLPIGFDYIEKWLENRKASKHNSHLLKIMKDCGCDKAEGFIKVTHAASINDTFWVKAKDESVTWKQISFYQNKFNEVISRLAFEGVGLYGMQLSTTSPELSTDGSFRKCWQREADGIYLYKRGSFGARNAGLEPYGEVLAAELASKIISGAVSYQLTKLHGELASKCKLFTDEQFGYVSASRFPIKHESPNALMKFYSEINSEDQFRRMIVLDTVIFNVDRHAGNHGVLVNNDTMERVKMAPVFDLNMALLPYVEKEEFLDIGKKLLEYGPRIGEDFTRMGQQAATSSIRADLIGLKGFQFEFRGDNVFPEWRVKALEELVNRQIEAVISKEILQTQNVFIPKAEPEEILNKVETSDKLHEQERVAEELQWKLSDTGHYLTHQIQMEEDRIKLVMIPRGYANVDIIIDIDDKSVIVEIDGIESSLDDVKLEYPKVYECYKETSMVMDGFDIPKEAGNNEIQPVIPDIERD